MNREQAFNAFWGQFGVPVYDEYSVPEDAKLPYITYTLSVDEFNYPVSLVVSIWNKSTSWISVTNIAERIENVLNNGGRMIKYDGGAFWISKGHPWTQRMDGGSAGDTPVKRLVLNVEVEYIK